MKGVYSSADSVHAMACDAALFPDTPYSRSSGGDPLAITALTPQRFAAFHAENYSPARARLWFFGDDPEAKGAREWVGDWDQHVKDREVYAKELQAGEDARFLESTKGARQLSRAIDAFAQVNKMPSCETPQDVG
jgi:predicted Zn-dependent peptidase